MKKPINYIFAPIVLAGILCVTSVAFASIGVGVGAGKIMLTQPLKPGTIYQLPSFPVINTGDEGANYGISIEYNEVQAQLKPKQDWFTFSPTTFHLAPGKSQVVQVSVAVPVKAVPGEYFAYLEAHPIKADIAGVTSIGVAAASKLSFTVAPANIFQGIYYRLVSLVTRGAPWTYIAIGLLALWVLIRILKKYFKFNIAINVKK